MAPVSFYYRTDTITKRSSYDAEQVWAIHEPNNSSVAENFLLPGSDQPGQAAG